MASYQVLSWRDLPSQVRAEDGADEVTLELPAEFQAKIDAAAQAAGATGEDAYLDGWAWSDPAERPGSASDVAHALVGELGAAFGR